MWKYYTLLSALFAALTGDLSRVAPIEKLSVVIMICLSFLLLKEPVNASGVVGASLITGGSMVMLMK